MALVLLNTTAAGRMRFSSESSLTPSVAQDRHFVIPSISSHEPDRGPGIRAEYFDFRDHTHWQTSLEEIPARIKAGQFVWIDIDLTATALGLLKTVLPISAAGWLRLDQLTDHGKGLEEEPVACLWRSEGLLDMVLVGTVCRVDSIDWERCDILLGEGFLVTASRGACEMLAAVRREYAHDFQQHAVTPSFLIYEIWSGLINQFRTAHSELEKNVEAIRLAIYRDVNEGTLSSLADLSGKLMVLRKRVLPARRVLEDLVSRKTALISASTLDFFGKMIETLDRLLADIESDRDILESAVNLTLTFTAHRTNLTMNRLAVVSTIFLPLTFLCGVYGMNFAVLPEVQWRHGYAYFWVLSLVISVTLIIMLRRARLL
ncbi:MAG: hypothetical protein DWH79_00625 [Planctomycetota bacterium]|nr:MAG: hypothetical protein DWH79_00625 [Planctomycetota bacterium]